MSSAALTSPALTFADLGLDDGLLSTLSDLGFTEPTQIQATAIPPLLDGRDVTGVAQTGTGKTAAFGLPLLTAVDTSVPAVQALVLAPTRELAMQVAGAIESLAAGMSGLTVVPVYGGAPFGPQRTALRRGAQVVVGTPGRIIDHLQRGSLDLSAVRMVVLDEADEMLRMGFAEDVDTILVSAPAERQTALFSATMPAGIRAVAARHLRRPVDVSVKGSAVTVSAIRQRYAVLPFRQKTDALARILATSDADATIVFVRTRSACEELGAELVGRGVSAAVISGDVAQAERERTIERLRNGRLDVLVATDVAARGLDVERVDLVVNFDAPGDPESYVHRVGRTGRAGRSGEALLFVTPREISTLRAIERATGQRLTEMTPPTAADVAAHRAAVELRAALTRHGAGRLERYVSAIERALTDDGPSAVQLAAALLAVASGDDGTEPETVPEPQPLRPHADSDRGGRLERREGRSDRTPAGPRYRVEVGRNHGVRPAGIVGAITAEGGLSGKDLGRIDIFDTFSTVEIGGAVGAAALARISRATVSGQTLRIQLDDSDGGRTTGGGARGRGAVGDGGTAYRGKAAGRGDHAVKRAGSRGDRAGQRTEQRTGAPRGWTDRPERVGDRPYGRTDRVGHGRAASYRDR